MTAATTPADPMTLMAEAASAAHELFTSYVDAGFTSGQAIYLVGQILTASLRSNEGGTE